jgi:hypothetical protein
MKTTLVVTSIAAPNAILRALAAGCQAHQIDFILIGDVPSPADFSLAGCRFYGMEQQLKTGLSYASLCPPRHYARKNIGYLLAAREGNEVIIETDDDNLPLSEFWEQRQQQRAAAVVDGAGWVNLYRYFTSVQIWPRGFPLSRIHHRPPARETLTSREIDAPIQQGLADANPDVDAIYRLVLPLPQSFAKQPPVAIGTGTWCPFNSQNTTWFRDAFALLYLPAHCSFRMTDIWRSFVAQRIAWENNWPILFHAATVEQERNDHNLMRDFNDEVVGYQSNEAICDALAGLPLRPGRENLGENLVLCYQTMVEKGWVGARELPLLQAWLSDLTACGLFRLGKAG